MCACACLYALRIVSPDKILLSINIYIFDCCVLQLCFSKGDIVTVTQVLDGGWWEAHSMAKQAGSPATMSKKSKLVSAASERFSPFRNSTTAVSERFPPFKNSMTERFSPFPKQYNCSV